MDSSNTPIPFNKTIWILWFQGFENAPWLVQQAAESWKIHNPGWTIVQLTSENIREYVDTDYLYDTQKKITDQAKSDIVRLSLLNKYGGVWADATMLCMQPLDPWILEAVKPAQFWMYHGRDEGKGPASSFLASYPKCYIINKWKRQCDKYWNSRSETDNYFWMDQLFKDLYEYDLRLLSEWKKVPYLWYEAEGQAHLLSNSKHNCYIEEIQQILQKNPPYMVKLWHHWHITFTNMTTTACTTSNTYYAIQMSKRTDGPKTDIGEWYSPSEAVVASGSLSKPKYKMVFCVYACATLDRYKKQILMIQDTWGKRAEELGAKVLYFLGEQETELQDESRYIYLKGVKNDFESMSHKQIKGLKYIYDNYDTDYVFISGADLFVNVDILFSELSLYNSANPLYMGGGYDTALYRTFGQTHYQFHNGGTGIVVSNKLLTILQPYLEDMYAMWKLTNKKYKHSLHNARDIMLGYFISKYIPNASYITNSLFTQREYSVANASIPDRLISYYPTVISDFITYSNHVKTNNYFIQKEGNYDSDTDESEELVFMKSNPPKIYYGTIDIKKDVTALVLEKCISEADGKIHIKKSDKERDLVFGDPIHGKHKSIFITNQIHDTTYRKCIDEHSEIIMRII
jgi:hypothetical protein